MPRTKQAKIVRIYIGERDRFDGKLLYEALVERFREMHLAGATVFRALEGFGESAEIHRDHLLGHDQPIVVTVVESEENVARLLPEVEAMLQSGMIAVSDVQIVRVRNGLPDD